MPLFKFSYIDSDIIIATVLGERPPWNALFESVIVGKTSTIEAALPEILAVADSPAFISTLLPFHSAFVRQQDVAGVVGFIPQWEAFAVSSVHIISTASAILPALVAEIIGENTAAGVIPRLDVTCLSSVSTVSAALAVLPPYLADAVGTVSGMGSISAIIPFIEGRAVSSLLGGVAFISAEIPFYTIRLFGLSGSHNFGSEDDEVLRYASSRRYI